MKIYPKGKWKIVGGVVALFAGLILYPFVERGLPWQLDITFAVAGIAWSLLLIWEEAFQLLRRGEPAPR